MRKLVKGKTTTGEWYVRPADWAGVYKGYTLELNISSSAVLFTTDKEETADKYIKAYNLIELVNEEVEKHEEVNKKLFVYSMDDYEWWVSDLNEEDTVEAYCNEYGLKVGEDIEIDNIKECDIYKDGMYWNFADNKEITNLIKDLLCEERNKKIEFGKLKCYLAYYEGPAIYIPFIKAIRLYGKYEKPYMIACSEQ